MRIMKIRQVGGGARVVAMHEAAYQQVQGDLPMIDHVPVEGVAEITPDGTLEWIREPTAAGREAIIKEMIIEEEE